MNALFGLLFGHKPASLSITTKPSNTSDKDRIAKAKLKMYTWSTSNDGRVCPECAIMEEKLCRWDDPTLYSTNGGKSWKKRPDGAKMVHPGEDKGCRCTSLAYYPELVGEE